MQNTFCKTKFIELTQHFHVLEVSVLDILFKKKPKGPI